MSLGVQISMSPTDAAERVKALAQLFPAEIRKASARAGAAYRGRMRAIMRAGGGIHGVPRFAPLSQLSIALRGRHLPGGKLAAPAAIQLRAFSAGGFQVGWLSALDGWGVPFQESQTGTIDKESRHAMHKILGAKAGRAARLRARAEMLRGEAGVLHKDAKRGWFRTWRKRHAKDLIKQARGLERASDKLTETAGDPLVQNLYSRPARPMIGPFATSQEPELQGWIEGAARKFAVVKLYLLAQVKPAS
jgi:hypothetical protein